MDCGTFGYVCQNNTCICEKNFIKSNIFGICVGGKYIFFYLYINSILVQTGHVRNLKDFTVCYKKKLINKKVC